MGYKVIGHSSVSERRILVLISFQIYILPNGTRGHMTPKQQIQLADFVSVLLQAQIAFMSPTTISFILTTRYCV